MKCLVVLSHPLKESLCSHLCQQTIEHLEGKGYDITLLDLYEESFDPVLSAQERQSYYADNFDRSQLNKELEQLVEAESLVLVFPTWWFSFPAMLKGWIDRVWAPGYAYDHDAALGAIKPRLHRLKEVKVVTTLGSPWWVDNLVMRKPVKRVLKTAILGACAKDCRVTFLSLYNAEKASTEKVDKFVRKIKAKF
ncbi:NAD(P)H-dependent oxidoreductase [Enterovibrio paralichthyis]|uniref:NAD(P)H-dependent oxidoreductase n=1 Tax=Enterovibrio paralichthyis TaxID=2853805 RepID=UPI001C46CFB4|nr:NAD(P)H-dependent oxidoreductase [Enterovibrio paralichthyis]MBV7297082.1 NAD(P)H-dependent oxidoreductase [Enterovibrio paralichthyis]